MQMSDEVHPASPSVFVSSTVREFHDLRSALAYTLRSQGFRIYLSEAAEFDVRGDRSAIEECFENIRRSDYYILLIGATRGSLFEEGTSITRQEYRVARNGFLFSKKPRLFFYLLESVEVALSGSRKVQREAGIDDPAHLASFIGEVQQPMVEGVPNYLTRFNDFEDLIHSLESRLNLGRTLLERLARHSLLSELLSNLSLMVSRSKKVIFPTHWYMRRVRDELSITPEDLPRPVVLSDDHVVSLGFALIGRTKGKELRTRAIEEALHRGLFLVFNPATGRLEESPLHKALKENYEDIQALRQLDTSAAEGEWDSNILRDIKNKWGGRPNKLEIQGLDLAKALAHFDRVENVFNRHLALCKVLLGITEELESYHRQPTTPLGKLEDEKIREEKVLTEEIAFLIQSDIWPFGTLINREVFGTTREEQIEKIIDKMSASLQAAGIDSNLYNSDILRNVAEKYLDDNTI
jgi:hypothetical protein